MRLRNILFILPLLCFPYSFNAQGCSCHCHKKDTSSSSKTESKKIVANKSRQDSPALENIAKDPALKLFIEKLVTIQKKVEDVDDKKTIEIWLPAIIGVVALLLSFVGTYFQAKGNSVSAFRVKWIDDLRVAYGEFYVASQNVWIKQKEGKLNVAEDKDLDKMRFLQAKIKLLINHGEDEHIMFWEKFLLFVSKNSELYKLTSPDKKLEDEINDLKLGMEDLLVSIFKKEWDKAKRFK